MSENEVIQEQENQEDLDESKNQKSKIKVKVLQTVATAIGELTAGTVRTLELDDHTLNNWIENGLIEEVKGTRNKGKTNEDK